MGDDGNPIARVIAVSLVLISLAACKIYVPSYDNPYDPESPVYAAVTPPTIIGPAEGFGFDTGFTVKWKKTGTIADVYRLQVAAENDFRAGSVVLDTELQGVDNYTVPSLAFNGPVYCRLALKLNQNGVVWSPWSAVLRLVKSPPAGNRAPTVSLTPPVAVSVTGGAAVEFNAVGTDADGDVLIYRWYVDGAEQNARTAAFKFDIPILSVEKTYTIAVAVSDGGAGSLQTSVDIVVGSTADMKNWRLVNQSTAPSAGTTTTLPSFINGRLNISNRETTGNINSSGAIDTTLVYYNTAMTGNFLIRARVLVANPVASSTSKGVNLGAFSLESGVLASPLVLATAMIRTKADASRTTYTRKMNSDGTATELGTTSGINETLATVPLSVERIYQVERTADGIRYSVYASDADFSGTPTALFTELLGYSGGTTAGLLGTEITATTPMYVGFTVEGADVEVSNMVIKNASSTLFSSFAVNARPVMVSSVIVTGPVRNPITEDTTYISYQNSLSGAQVETLQLTAAVVPSLAADTSVTWASNNTNVATISPSGLVSAVAPGDARITATANDGTGFAGSYNLRLTASAISVTSITVTGTASINAGDSAMLTATILPINATYQTVTWTSSNTGVATIDTSGRATGISAGATVITALAADGSTVTGTFNLSVTLPVGILVWTFQVLPVGWSDNVNTSSSPYPAAYDYGQGLVLNCDTRTMKLLATGTVPITGGTGFSIGYLQPGGARKFATLANVQGPFSLKLNYSAAGTTSGGRYPGIYIDGVLQTPTATPSAGTTDGQTFIYSYTGTSIVTVTLNSEGNAIRLYDLVFTPGE